MREPLSTVETDDDLIDALSAGDERAFSRLVDSLAPSMVRVARGHVPNQAVAEEVVQETWLVVLKGLDRFERRSSLKTWIFGILVNIARTHGSRERRSVPVSGFDETGPHELSVAPTCSTTPGSVAWCVGRAQAPRSWGDDPEDVVMGRETLHHLHAALTDLPPRQRRVVELHDVVGMPTEDICDLLSLSAGNQRVLLHRGRAKVRKALEGYLTATG